MAIFLNLQKLSHYWMDTNSYFRSNASLAWESTSATRFRGDPKNPHDLYHSWIYFDALFPGP